MRVVSLCVLTLGIGLILGGWLQGQDKKEPPETKKTGDVKVDEPKAKGQLPAGWKKLGLTDEQVQSVYKTQSAYNGKIDGLKQKIADLKAEEKAELEKILTKAQKD